MRNLLLKLRLFLADRLVPVVTGEGDVYGEPAILSETHELVIEPGTPTYTVTGGAGSTEYTSTPVESVPVIHDPLRDSSTGSGSPSSHSKGWSTSQSTPTGGSSKTATGTPTLSSTGV